MRDMFGIDYFALSGLISRLCLIYKGFHPLQNDIALSGLIDSKALKGRDIMIKGEALCKSTANSKALKGRDNMIKGVALCKSTARSKALKGRDNMTKRKIFS